MPALPPSRRAATAGQQPPNSTVPRPRRLTRGDRIIAALAPHIHFDDHLAHRVVCRAWRRSCRLIGRAPPPFPWLMLPPPAARGPAAPQRRVFYDIPGGRSYAYPVPAFYRYVGSRGGWLVLADSGPPCRLVVLNPITGGQVVVPWPFVGEGEDPSESFGFHAVMTASVCDPACFLAVATDRLIKYCRPAVAAADGSRWVTLRVPGFRYHAACSDLVSIGATVYLVDERRKLWRADLATAVPKVERRDMGHMASAFPQGERWLHYLVESFGHVLLVVSDEHHKRLGLYRLSRDRWEPTPAGGVGDSVLLLGRGCSVAVPASAAAGRSPGTVLVARQPGRWSSLHMGLNLCGGGGEQPWFWTESRLGDGLGDDQLVLKKTVHQRAGESSIGDSFWFFPAIDKSN